MQSLKTSDVQILMHTVKRQRETERGSWNGNEEENIRRRNRMACENVLRVLCVDFEHQLVPTSKGESDKE